MSSAPYPVVQKMTSSRRRTRAPARRFRFLVGEGTLRREGSVFSSDDARLDKTISSSRRTLRAPTIDPALPPAWWFCRTAPYLQALQAVDAALTPEACARPRQ